MSSDSSRLESTGLPAHFPHGGGIKAAARDWRCDVAEILDLSTGLHPAGAPDWLADWLHDHAALAAHYPDRHGEPARTALAAAFQLPPESILITAGAQAVIETIFQAMAWSSMAIEVPCYNEPLRCARRAGCTIRSFAAGDKAPPADLLWRTSPANPGGHTSPLIPGLQHTHTVLDESYMPFAERRSLGLPANLIRIGSLTKTFCIPGLRLGYVIADTHTIARLKAWLPPWPAATLAQHLLPALLPEADSRDQQTVAARKRLDALLQHHQWQIRPSVATFILARPNNSAPDFAAHRILIRTFPEWPQLTGWIRFGLPGSETAWQRLAHALDQSPAD